MLAALSSVRAFLFASKKHKDLLSLLPQRSLQLGRQERPTFVVSSIALRNSSNVMPFWVTNINGESQGGFKVVDDRKNWHSEFHYLRAINLCLSVIESKDLRNARIYFAHKGLEKSLKGKSKTNDPELQDELWNLRYRLWQAKATAEQNPTAVREVKKQIFWKL